MSVVRFPLLTWLLFLLACCLFVLCQSVRSSNAEDGLFSNSDPTGRYRRSSGRAEKSALTEPGIIVGIIVGVSGVLVVIGVAIFLCRLFCCKEASCTYCPCCKEKETYLEAGTVPIKIPTEDNPPDSNDTPLNTILQNRPVHARPSQGARKTPDTTAPSLPQYDDVDWKHNGLMEEKKQTWEPDAAERQSSPYSRRRSAENSLDLPANDRDEIPNSQLVSGGKRKEKTPTRRKLTYGADNPDVSQNSGDFIPLDNEPKKRNMEAARNGRQLPVTSQKHRKRPQPSHDDDRATTTVMERNPEPEVADGREFPLLEYEPRKRNFSPSYPDDTARPWEETRDADREFRPVEYTHQLQISHTSFPDDTSKPWEASPGNDDFRPMEYGHQPQVRQPPHPVPRSRMWGGEERRPGWDHREILSARAPVPFSNVNHPSGNVQPTVGRDNLAFNQDSTETSV